MSATVTLRTVDLLGVVLSGVAVKLNLVARPMLTATGDAISTSEKELTTDSEGNLSMTTYAADELAVSTGAHYVLRISSLYLPFMAATAGTYDISDVLVVNPESLPEAGASASALAAETAARVSGDAAALQKSNNLSDLTNTTTARTSLGLGNSATRAVGTTSSDVAAGDAPATAAAAAVSTHAAVTTSVHGISNTADLETTTGSAAKVTAHSGATDPHGDRAYTDNTIATLDAAVQTLGGRVTNIETGEAFLGGLQVVGDATITSGTLTAVDAEIGGINFLAPLKFRGLLGYAGPPLTGTWEVGDVVLGSGVAWHICTVAGVDLGATWVSSS